MRNQSPVQRLRSTMIQPHLQVREQRTSAYASRKASDPGRWQRARKLQRATRQLERMQFLED